MKGKVLRTSLSPDQEKKTAGSPAGIRRAGYNLEQADSQPAWPSRAAFSWEA